MPKTILPAFALDARPLTDAARAAQGFRGAGGDIGKRHQLGGEPRFLQPEEWPQCAACREEMSFYAQLDSIGDDVCIADCGMIYVFICFDCFETHSCVHSG
jgi:hypothetical protein